MQIFLNVLSLVPWTQEITYWRFEIFWGSMPQDTPGKVDYWPLVDTVGYCMYFNLLATSIFFKPLPHLEIYK